MTEAIIRRRLPRPVPADRVVVPGRCRADLDRLAGDLGVPFTRGPDELADLPAFLGRGGAPPDLSRYDIRIFAEIVEASELGVDAILAKALRLRDAGADVIDLGCLPDTPFPHLEASVEALKAAGLKVSVDSADADELERGNRAGADFLLSLTEATLSIAKAGSAVPVLIPSSPGDLDSLLRAIDAAEAQGLAFLADPVLDPDPFRLHRIADALCRAEAPAAGCRDPDGHRQPHRADRRRLARHHRRPHRHLLGARDPQRALRAGEPAYAPHRATSTTPRGGSCSPRARISSLPRGYGNALLALHDRKPFPTKPGEIAAVAAEVRDPNFRIEVCRGRHPRLQPRRPPRCDRCAVALSAPRRRGGRRACLLPGHRAGEGGDRLPARQALRAGRAARLGRGRRPAGGRPDAPRRGGPHACAPSRAAEPCR